MPIKEIDRKTIVINSWDRIIRFEYDGRLRFENISKNSSVTINYHRLIAAFLFI